MLIFKDLIVNFFFIFICYFMLVALVWIKRSAIEVNQLFLIGFASIAIVLCISFPFYVTEGILLDLRLVPLVVAGLYGGWRTCFALTVGIIGYRFMLGGEGLYYAIIVVVCYGLLISLVSKHFLSLTHRKRVLFSFFIGMVSPIIIVFLFSKIIHAQYLTTLTFNIVFVQTFAIVFFVFLSEMFIKIKNLNEHVIRSEKMEIVSYVASSFTHEIRNPLTTVKGFLQLMRRTDLKREEVENYISIAINEVDRAENIITDYLSFTKPMTEQLEDVDGFELLRSSIEVIRPLANANCVDIQYNYKPFWIQANKQKMQQVLINLYKNAIEAMPNGGNLFISVELKGDSVLLSITDTGVGMTKEQISRLGEPYFSSKGEKGTGLGMMVVYNIVEAIGGSIKVESQSGVGTSFFIVLPQILIRDRKL